MAEWDKSKYDDICTKALQEAEAEGIVLIVIGGKHGHGMSIRAMPDVQRRIPSTLRNVARDLDAQLRLEVDTVSKPDGKEKKKCGTGQG